MTSDTYHHGDLRAALIAEAGRVLAQDGPSAISLRGLARTLDVSHAAPRYHFPTIADLHEALAADGYHRLATHIGDRLPAVDGEAADRFVAAGQAVTDFAFANTERYRLMFSYRLFVGDDIGDELGVAASEAYAMLDRAVLGEQSRWHPGDAVDDRSLGAWSLVHGAIMLWIEGQFPLLIDEAQFRSMLDHTLAAVADSLAAG
ncbi:MAG: TetR-like C-terminal domain-containing protein [Actinomycetota bacterium]